MVGIPRSLGTTIKAALVTQSLKLYDRIMSNLLAYLSVLLLVDMATAQSVSVANLDAVYLLTI